MKVKLNIPGKQAKYFNPEQIAHIDGLYQCTVQVTLVTGEQYSGHQITFE